MPASFRSCVQNATRCGEGRFKMSVKRLNKKPHRAAAMRLGGALNTFVNTLGMCTSGPCRSTVQSRTIDFGAWRVVRGLCSKENNS